MADKFIDLGGIFGSDDSSTSSAGLSPSQIYDLPFLSLRSVEQLNAFTDADGDVSQEYWVHNNAADSNYSAPGAVESDFTIAPLGTRLFKSSAENFATTLKNIINPEGFAFEMTATHGGAHYAHCRNATHYFLLAQFASDVSPRLRVYDIATMTEQANVDFDAGSGQDGTKATAMIASNAGGIQVIGGQAPNFYSAPAGWDGATLSVTAAVTAGNIDGCCYDGDADVFFCFIKNSVSSTADNVSILQSRIDNTGTRTEFNTTTYLQQSTVNSRYSSGMLLKIDTRRWVQFMARSGTNQCVCRTIELVDSGTALSSPTLSAVLVLDTKSGAISTSDSSGIGIGSTFDPATRIGYITVGSKIVEIQFNAGYTDYTVNSVKNFSDVGLTGQLGGIMTRAADGRIIMTGYNVGNGDVYAYDPVTSTSELLADDYYYGVIYPPIAYASYSTEQGEFYTTKYQTDEALCIIRDTDLLDVGIQMDLTINGNAVDYNMMKSSINANSLRFAGNFTNNTPLEFTITPIQKIINISI